MKTKPANASNQQDELVNVIIYNDDHTTMDFVIFMLKSVFDKPETEAKRIMLRIHNEGYGVVGPYPREIANAKVSAIRFMASIREFPLLCALEGEDPNATTETDTQHVTPTGWVVAGSQPEDYEVGIDTKVFHSGSRCASIRNAVEAPRGFATLMQQFSADPYRQNRLRMRMFVKALDILDRVQPWMRIEGPPGHMLALDNACERPIKGTTKWQEFKIVLDVPDEATNIAFGVMLFGTGQVWIDDIVLEPVTKVISTTDCVCRTGRPKNIQAINLNFEE